MADTLRTDERSWLIYGDEQTGAFIRAAEMYALSVTGQKLARHPDQRIRAVGHLMLRIGESRGRELIARDGAAAVAVRHFARMGAVLAGQIPPAGVDSALDELQSVAVHIDSRAASAGIGGPGLIRAGVRGD